MELIKINKNNEIELKQKYINQIIKLEQQAKAIKEKQDVLKQLLLDGMEQNNLIKIDTPELAINYIAPFDKETFDSKAFRKDHADLYDEYVKMTTVKSSVRIKVKQ